MAQYLQKILLFGLSLNLISTVILNENVSDENVQYIRYQQKLSGMTQVTSSEHITSDFYKAAENADITKNKLQAKLHNFLEHLQKNLTTSSVLNTIVNNLNMQKTHHQLRKLENLSAFFYTAYMDAYNFSESVENFFEVSKNESNFLLLKIRNVPSAQKYLSAQTKIFLTEYFAEMEYFHIKFSEIVDEALEYIVDTLRTTQASFIKYADIQRDVLRNWNFKPDEWCCNKYMEFLQYWSAVVYKCATGDELLAVYDVYATTESSIKYIIRQQEFRIQRLYNCFLFGNYYLKCRFLRQAENDFKILFAKLEELQMYYYLKIQGGRILANRHIFNQHMRHNDDIKKSEENEILVEKKKCIPRGFPQQQMMFSLKKCFYFPLSDSI